jgi:NAD(P)-dependent dehydrogenase (short-subunit alcohol dehydrogenase family)
MLLEGKNAVVYGGGGGIGGAVARAFAREGARVYLAGRTRERLEGGHEPHAVAAELGRALAAHGLDLCTGGVPETLPTGFEGREAIVASIEEQTMLDRTATLEDVGNMAAFVASDRARTMTAATANISCGALIDW